MALEARVDRLEAALIRLAEAQVRSEEPPCDCTTPVMVLPPRTRFAVTPLVKSPPETWATTTWVSSPLVGFIEVSWGAALETVKASSMESLPPSGLVNSRS